MTKSRDPRWVGEAYHPQVGERVRWQHVIGTCVALTRAEAIKVMMDNQVAQAVAETSLDAMGFPPQGDRQSHFGDTTRETMRRHYRGIPDDYQSVRRYSILGDDGFLYCLVPYGMTPA